MKDFADLLPFTVYPDAMMPYASKKATLEWLNDAFLHADFSLHRHVLFSRTTTSSDPSNRYLVDEQQKMGTDPTGIDRSKSIILKRHRKRPFWLEREPVFPNTERFSFTETRR